MAQQVIGIIGGSGLYEIDGLSNVEHVTLTTPFGDPDACSGGATSATVVLSAGSFADRSQYKEAYAAILAAYLSGKNLQFSLSGCRNIAGTNQPKIINVAVSN